MENTENNVERNYQKENKRYLLGFLLMGLVTLILVGGAYAFFTPAVTGTETDTTITIGAGTLGIVMDGGNIITMNNIYPRAEAWETKRFTVTGNNSSTMIMDYSLNLVVTQNTFASGSLLYTLTSINTGATGTVAPNIATQTGIPTGAGTHALGSGVFNVPGTNMVHTYYLTFFFPSRGVPQNEDQGAQFRAHVGIIGLADGSPTTTTTTTVPAP